MFAVYKREFRAYMTNVYGWLFMAVLLLFVGVMVFLENLIGGAPYIEYALLMGEYALILLIPILCMRSMAEDQKNKTDMFYLSLPIRTSAVVLGKYLALLTVYALPCAVIATYPVLLAMFGKINFVGSYSSILFFFLLGAALIAVCQFTSSLTDNLVVAGVLGVVGLLVLFGLPRLGYTLPEAALVSYVGFLVLALLVAGIAYLTARNPVVAVVTAAVLILPLSALYIFMQEKFVGLLPNVLERMGPFTCFEETCRYGLFSIPSLILLLSYPVFFVLLTVLSADRKRWA